MSRSFNKQFAGLAAMKDPVLGITFDWGTAAPTDATAGFSTGCVFLVTNASAGINVYQNVGTQASCDFNKITGTDLSALTTTATELNLLSGLLATAAEINRNNKASTRDVAGGASLTVTQVLHDGKTILLDTATGTAVTLPAMTGSGSRFRFVCTASTSGGSTVITATGAHLFGGVTMNTDTTAGTLFTCVAAANAGGSTTITLDGSTKGGRKGDWLEIEDVATSIGIVRGSLNGSGTEATPFA